ncbi:hypothetical protein ABZY58_12055 [Micromonospora tulbaghiae]|uniref:hypothetical protein n=1 Tax=Micromonospora tulbaghiae TaxID=479978 RepID=UPI0033A4D8F8
MSWITEVRSLHGEPAVERMHVQLGKSMRSVWVWFIDGVNHNVSIERLHASQWTARVSSAEGTVTWTGPNEPADQMVRALCTTAGLLPPAPPPVPHNTADLIRMIKRHGQLCALGAVQLAAGDMAGAGITEVQAADLATRIEQRLTGTLAAEAVNV